MARTYTFVPGRGVISNEKLRRDPKPSATPTEPTVDENGTVWTARAVHQKRYADQRSAQGVELARRDRARLALKHSRERWTPPGVSDG